MGREPLPSTLGSFDWGLPFTSSILGLEGDAVWRLRWQFVSVLAARIDEDGIPPSHIRWDKRGTRWTPAVDLGLGNPVDLAWHGSEQYAPTRLVCSIAQGRCPGRLLRGTVLVLAESVVDRHYAGLDVTNWRLLDAEPGPPFLHSADGLRWVEDPVVADRLIVPLDHPIVGDDARADRLVLDLQSIVRDFRSACGLPAEGDGGAQPGEHGPGLAGPA